MARIDFEVTTDALKTRLWVQVGDNDPEPVSISNGVGHKDLPAGEHDFLWSIAGTPGQKIAVIGKQASETILKTGGEIQPGKLKARAAKYFTVKGTF